MKREGRSLQLILVTLASLHTTEGTGALEASEACPRPPDEVVSGPFPHTSLVPSGARDQPDPGTPPARCSSGTGQLGGPGCPFLPGRRGRKPSSHIPSGARGERASEVPIFRCGVHSGRNGPTERPIRAHSLPTSLAVYVVVSRLTLAGGTRG